MSNDESPCPHKSKRDLSIIEHQDAVNRLEEFIMPPLQLGNIDRVRYDNRTNEPVTVREAVLSEGKRKRRRKSKKRKTRKRKNKRKRTRKVKRKRKTLRKKRSRRKN